MRCLPRHSVFMEEEQYVGRNLPFAWKARSIQQPLRLLAVLHKGCKTK
jgi:hypothetical protein